MAGSCLRAGAGVRGPAAGGRPGGPGVRGAGSGQGDVAGLPELVVEGRAARDARALLESVLTGPLDPRVRDRIIADTNGNPLALLELPRGLTAAQLTGGFGLSSAVPWTGGSRRVSRGSWRRCRRRPGGCCKLAAADPSGDPVLVWRAAGRLPAIDAAGGRDRLSAGRGWRSSARGVRFRHPLVRSAAYRSASAQTRQELHGALAEVTDLAADRWSAGLAPWAQAAPGPDEEVAAEPGAVRGPGPAPRWSRRSGRVPGAVRRADPRSGPPRAAGAGRSASQAPGGRT